MIRPLLALMFLAAAPQDKPGAAPPAQEQPAPEETQPVQKGNLTPVFELEAVYESVESADFKLRLEAYQGELTLVKVAGHGEPVKKGDPILAVDRAPLERQVASAENELRVARAALEKAQTDLDLGAKADGLALLQAQNGVKDAETALRIFEEVEGKNLVRQAELSVQYGEEGMADQKEELDQLLKMYKTEELTNATAEIVVRRARRQLERAEVYLQMARAEAGVTKTVRYPQQLRGFKQSVEAAKNGLESVKAQQALSRVQRDAEAVRARATVAQQEEQLARLKRDVQSFPWRAPFDGRVFYGQFQNGQWATAEQMALLLHPGEKLQPGQVLLTVCGGPTRARADLAEADYFDVAPGQAAVVVPVATPDAKSEGAVKAKSVTSAMKGGGAAFDVRIEFPQPPADLYPGMKGKATIRGKELRDVVIVPSNAVAAAGSKSTVTVSKEGKSSPREVTVGKSDGKMTHVKSGLEAGEKIVLPK